MKSTFSTIIALSLFLAGITATTLTAAQTAPANETRVEKANILKHPIGQVALKYADALHGGDVDEVMTLSSSEAQARWNASPKSERKESAAFRKKLLPDRAGLKAGIESGGVLIIEGGTRATLNVIKIEVDSSKSGVSQSSSSTVAMPFVFEGGQWKFAN